MKFVFCFGIYIFLYVCIVNKKKIFNHFCNIFKWFYCRFSEANDKNIKYTLILHLPIEAFRICGRWCKGLNTVPTSP